MKTETQIAQENVDEIRDTASPTQKGILREQAREFKEKDQRFLEFLRGLLPFDRNEYINKRDDKITDLKQAIKLYEDAGI